MGVLTYGRIQPRVLGGMQGGGRVVGARGNFARDKVEGLCCGYARERRKPAAIGEPHAETDQWNVGSPPCSKSAPARRSPCRKGSSGGTIGAALGDMASPDGVTSPAGGD